MRKLILAFSLALTSIVYSQETPTEFSLQEAINYALENNRSSKNAALDIEAAIKQKWETTATGLPQLNATVDYQNALKRNVFVFGDQIIQVGSQHTLTGTATLSQLLFDGSYLVGLQSAKVYLEISKNAKTKTDLEVRKAVINAYGNVLLAEESVAILEKNITVLEKNLNDITKIFENGLEEEESVEQLKITLSSVKSTLNNTTRLKDLAYQMLNLTIGKPINDNIVLTENLDTLALQNITIQLLDSENNVENNIDYKIAENDKTTKELLVKLEKSKALPSLSAFINGGYTGNRESFNFTDTNEKWFGSSIFGVSLNVPIFSSGMRNAATQRAKINLEKAEINLTETEQMLNLQIQSAKSDYQFAIEDYQNKKENLILAERIETKNQTKFFEGIGSSFELRQAQTQLYTAQQELLQTMLDVITKKAELETLLNTTN
ncbi:MULTISPECIES: TolC family protein [unclassified Olleya]|jgi:outer membrane protein TolC|uniref:TolC family protein n=1 Tax=unclassified Olleya TaxID=2615019 RepID=UPI0011A92597|nr:TolC family protein [Olleya sp. Hel_I_94]TVZ48444.1 outer membrane protein TolC [Olleya sp. Hel_I_94]|tara:strand:+ start:137526 stop:138833 length:1308 start_codon:yes stop_codon:yes gene_type:complete